MAPRIPRSSGSARLNRLRRLRRLRRLNLLHLRARLGGQRALFFAVLWILASAIGCAKPYDPFQVPRDEIREGIRTVAVSPHAAPYSQMDADRSRETFEPAATRRLEAAGLRVVPSEVWSGIWRRAAQDLGGLYDPSTAEYDKEKLELVQEALYTELANDHDVDAILLLRVVQVERDLTFAELSFCGKRGRVNFLAPQRAGSPEPNKRRNKGGIGPVVAAYASCLSASLYDMEGNFLYGIRHGLEVFDTYARQTRAKLPRDERLRDPAAIEEALEAVIGPLADGYAGAD